MKLIKTIILIRWIIGLRVGIGLLTEVDHFFECTVNFTYEYITIGL